jgi:hypothetical protein
MMRKAGFIERNGRTALDEDGTPCEIIEVRIAGTRYAMRASELRRAVNSNISARVERLRQNWKPYLGGISGLALRSRSGRALNLDMISGDKFTISLDAVCAVLTRRERYAVVFAIPAVPASVTDWSVSADRKQVVPDFRQLTLPI